MLSIKKPKQDNARHISRRLLAERVRRYERRDLMLELREARG